MAPPGKVDLATRDDMTSIDEPISVNLVAVFRVVIHCHIHFRTAALTGSAIRFDYTMSNIVSANEYHPELRASESMQKDSQRGAAYCMACNRVCECLADAS
jgi:hypothetical protein